MTDGIREAIERARAGSASLLRIERSDGAEPVAFLVSVGRAAGDVVVPLAAGLQTVGRRGVFVAWPKPHVVEAAQWQVECRGHTACVRDASSTNLSSLTAAGGDATREIPHANAPGGDAWLELREGDVLRGCYATFAFGWFTRRGF